MRKLVAGLFMSLDGVVESPGPWGFKYADAEVFSRMGEGVAQADAVLLGRITYEEFSKSWPLEGTSSPMATFLNGSPKYVVSSTLAQLEWGPAERLEGDLAAAVSRLKSQPGKNIQIPGSPRLVAALLAPRPARRTEPQPGAGDCGAWEAAVRWRWRADGVEPGRFGYLRDRACRAELRESLKIVRPLWEVQGPRCGNHARPFHPSRPCAASLQSTSAQYRRDQDPSSQGACASQQPIPMRFPVIIGTKTLLKALELRLTNVFVSDQRVSSDPKRSNVSNVRLHSAFSVEDFIQLNGDNTVGTCVQWCGQWHRLQKRRPGIANADAGLLRSAGIYCRGRPEY